ncbi:hypothetical protein [Mycolicibacterium sp.]|uniref:hypothetical protein n=1 Tax=Mycolicibacterium sp. TaxID=2320850 RepID=UPI00355D6FA4
MSWDAELIDEDSAAVIGDWNYTHNVNAMAHLVLYPDADIPRSVFDEVFSPQNTPWWRLLDGRGGADGAALLGEIIAGLRATPERFRALNPANGWGNYEQFLALLEQMRDAVPAGARTRWSVSG